MDILILSTYWMDSRLIGMRRLACTPEALRQAGDNFQIANSF
jgi:hypothetical protein